MRFIMTLSGDFALEFDFKGGQRFSVIDNVKQVNAGMCYLEPDQSEVLAYTKRIREAYAAKTNSTKGLNFPVGLNVLHGIKESGKSWLMRFLLGEDHTFDPLLYKLSSADRSFSLIRAFEHEAEGAIFSEPLFYKSFADMIITSEAPVIAVDSLRVWMFAGGKAAGARGMNQMLLASLSTLNALALSFGKSLIVVMNTQGGGAELDAMMNDILPGASPTVITARSPGSYQLHTRIPGIPSDTAISLSLASPVIMDTQKDVDDSDGPDPIIYSVLENQKNVAPTAFDRRMSSYAANERDNIGGYQ